MMLVVRGFVAIAFGVLCASSVAEAQRFKPFTEQEKNFEPLGAHLSCRSAAKPPAEGFLYEITNAEMIKSATKNISISGASTMGYYVLTETHPSDFSKLKDVAVLDAWAINLAYTPSWPLDPWYTLSVGSRVPAKDLKVAKTHGQYGQSSYVPLASVLGAVGVSCRRADSTFTKPMPGAKPLPPPPAPPVAVSTPAQVKYDGETRKMWLGYCVADGNAAVACGCFHDRLKKNLPPFHWHRWGQMVRQSPSVILEPYTPNSEWSFADYQLFTKQYYAAFPACGVKPRR